MKYIVLTFDSNNLALDFNGWQKSTSYLLWCCSVSEKFENGRCVGVDKCLTLLDKLLVVHHGAGFFQTLFDLFNVVLFKISWSLKKEKSLLVLVVLSKALTT